MRLPSKFWGSRVPGWALGLGAKGYHRLMGIVGAEARARGLDFQFDDEGSVRLGTRVENARELDLRALARECAESPAESWEALVAERIDEALR
ncbi:MAG: hypothetical protein ACOX6T_14885 [Myxococcales bacterium]|jgi:hypothetical protein